MYLPEAVFVCSSSWRDEHAVFQTERKALDSLAKNHIYRVGFVSIGDYNITIYRKALDWPFEDIPKHLFEVVEVPNANGS